MSEENKDDASSDVFDLTGSDPDLLNTGRIPDPEPQHTPFFRWCAGAFSAVEARLRARGGDTLRMGIRSVWILLAAVGVFLLVGPVINAPASIDDIITSARIENVDWVARDATLNYDISRDEDGGFRAEIHEQYTADFINGSVASIRRVVVSEYAGHDARFTLQQATIDGEPADVTVNRGATITTVTFRKADGSAFTGTADVVFDYSLRNLVTLAHDDALQSTYDGFEWPALAPAWPQAINGLDVSVTLTPELDAQLVRQPHATLGWLLVSGSVWLTPEVLSTGTTYAFTNDQTIPPHGEIWLALRFAPGTFTLPPTTPLYWWQTWGPLLPLAILALMVPFAYAARRIVWADHAGEPWYVAREDPPKKVSARLAAQLLHKPGHIELVTELDTNASSETLAAAARRAGRLGTTWAGRAYTKPLRKKDPVIDAGLRWRPDSYLRDSFILAPIALTLIQWGLLRQLSHQVILVVVWWPVLFVVISTALAVLAIVPVWRPRPLTKQGALIVQHLKGMHVWAQTTQVFERGPTSEKPLAYGALFEPARRMGASVLALVQAETGDQRAGSGWRGRNYLSPLAVAAAAIAACVLAGAIVIVSTQRAPYAEDERPITWSHELDGTLYTTITGIDLAAKIGRGPAGQAQVTVTETLNFTVYPGSAQLPQLAREWPASRFGHDLGLEVVAVRVDDTEAPFRQIARPETNSTVMYTQFERVYEGDHVLTVTYSINAAAVEADGKQVVRWQGWYDFWEDTYYTSADPFGGSAPVRPLRIQVTIDSDVVAGFARGGWLTYDPDKSGDRLERDRGWRDWQSERRVYLDRSSASPKSVDLLIGEQRTTSDGSLVADIDLATVQSRPTADPGRADAPYHVDPEVNASLSKYDLDLNGELGVLLYFDHGTFTTDSDAQSAADIANERNAPFVMFLLLTLIALVSIIATTVLVRRRSTIGNTLTVMALVTGPLLYAAHAVLFWWIMAGIPNNAMAWFTVFLGIVTSIAALFLVISASQRAEADTPASPARQK